MLFPQAVVAMLASWCLLLLFRELAGPLDLVDTPNKRKLHYHPIPLVGGIAVVPVLCVILLLFFPSPIEAAALVCAMMIIFAMGIIDDRTGLPARLRLLIQMLAAAIVVVFGGASITTLGNLFGLGEIHLGAASELFSVVCIVTTINAFNMIDGTDGLLGGLLVVTLLALAGLFGWQGQIPLVTVCLVSAAALLPYIYANLQSPKDDKKVFMGDAGSMTLGLFISYLVIKGACGFGAYQPVTALFLVALPIFDTIRVFGTRLSRGVSPFTPEQNHLHHLLMFRGKAQAAIILIVSSAAIAAVGSALSATEAPDFISMTVFCLVLLLLMAKVRLAVRLGGRLIPIDVSEDSILTGADGRPLAVIAGAKGAKEPV